MCNTEPFLFFTGSNPVDGFTTNYNNFETQIHIDKDYIDDFDYTFDGTTYDVYDSGLLFMANFDNVWILEEIDGDTIINVAPNESFHQVQG